MVQKVALDSLPLDFALVTRTAKDAMLGNDFFTEYCAKLNIPLPGKLCNITNNNL